MSKIITFDGYEIRDRSHYSITYPLGIGCKSISKKQLLEVKKYIQKKGGAKTVNKLHDYVSDEYNLKKAIKTGKITTEKINQILKFLE